MSRKMKQMVESELKGRYGALTEALVVNVIGLTGVDNNKLRRALRNKKLDMHVVPNRAFRRASAGTSLEALSKALTGPCAIVSGGESAIEMAKELVRIAVEFPKLELRFARVEGFDEPVGLEAASKLKSRVETIGDAVMLIVSPGRRLAGAVRAPGGKVAGCIKSLIEKLEKGEAVAKVA